MRFIFMTEFCTTRFYAHINLEDNINQHDTHTHAHKPMLLQLQQESWNEEQQQQPTHIVRATYTQGFLLIVCMRMAGICRADR